MKKIMIEKKTTLPSIRNEEWKKITVESVKVNKFSSKYPEGQRHWTELANLCGSETCLSQIQCSPKEAEQKYKNWTRN